MQSSHDIGQTNFKYASNPDWDRLEESDESKRLQQILPSEGPFFESKLKEAEETSGRPEEVSVPLLKFPFLQPIKNCKPRTLLEGDSSNLNIKVDSWSSLAGAIVFEVRFKDVLNKLPGFDDVLGEVAVPISKVIESGTIKGWFRLGEVGTTGLTPLADEELREDGPLLGNEGDNSSEARIFIELKFQHPTGDKRELDLEREASAIVAEELVKSAARSREGKLDLIGSSIGAFNTVRGLSGHVQFVQNLLGSILDVIESGRNAFNFTDPYKSSVVLAILTFVWIFLAIVPTRALILMAGLGQYAATFVAAFGPGRSSSEDMSESPNSTRDDKESPGSPLMIWILNAIRGLPTDEDLRKVYFWESRRVGERESEKLAAAKRASRLERLWKAQWYSFAHIKSPTTHKRSSVGAREWQWEEVFAMVQGHRFLWWPTARDFDNGEVPAGRIFLAGHAGLAGLSPLDLRELRQDEVPLVVSIFGRGIHGQQKIALLLEDAKSKKSLELAIEGAFDKED